MTRTAPSASQPRRMRRSVAAILGGALLLGTIPFAALPVSASTGGSAVTAPVTAVLTPLTADGKASGTLGKAIDLPVMLGDIGSYILEGTTAPSPSANGNGSSSKTYPAGPIDGVITNPKNNKVDSDPGRGIEIGGGTDSVVRTPAGLRATTELDGVVIDIAQLSEKVGAVLGRDTIASADRVVTTAAAHISGQTRSVTAVEGLTLLGEQIPVAGGIITEPAVRTQVVQSNDVVALLRSLGVKEKDIDQYAGFIKSSSLDGVFTVTASMPAEGGLMVTAALKLRIKADAGLLGGADLTADNIVLSAVFARTAITSPTAMAPRSAALAMGQAEPGDVVGASGIGFAAEATSVTIGGAAAENVTVVDDGTSLQFTVPQSLAGGNYSVVISTPGGSTPAGSLKVIADDTVPLKVAAVTPARTADGATVSISGAGFVPAGTSVLVTDASGDVFAIAASAVEVAESGVSMTLRLPEGLALGTATIAIRAGEETGSITVEIIPLELPAVPSTGSAAVTGFATQNTAVPLKVDNSGSMTWKAPTLLNPAGTTSTTTELQVGVPALDASGRGTATETVGGMSGTVIRELDRLTASAKTSNFALSLPAPWDGFFAAGPIVTADSLEVTSIAPTSGDATNSVALNNLRVLGNQVAVVDGALQQAQEFSLSLTSDTLKARRAMDGVFFDEANEAYNRLKSATSASLWVRVEPVAAAAAAGSASAGAFRVVADLRYNYEGENSGLIKTRARHGSGDSRSGERVNVFTSTIASTSVTAPDAVSPEVVQASPRLVDVGDTVTLTGRGYTADTVVLFGATEVTQTTVSSDGSTVTFVVPSASSGANVTAVRTAAGVSVTNRTVTVMDAPAFTEHPESLTVRSSAPVTFSARATGAPAPTLQWQRQIDGVWQNIDGETGQTFTFAPTETDNGMRVRVQASNVKDTVVSRVAVLTYEAAPVVITGPLSGTWHDGETARFSVEYSSVPAPTFVWQRDRGAGWVTIPDASGPELDYVVSPLDHDARIRVVLSNDLGSVESTPALLWVSYAPTVTAHPSPATVAVGSTAVFTAAAVGNPTPSVQWQYRMELGGQWVDVDADVHPSATETTLSLPVKTSYDGLLFRAVFSNSPESHVASDAALLTATLPNPEPGAQGLSSLASPLKVGVTPLIGSGSASGGNLSGLVNAELSKGVEVGKAGLFFLPELGTPTKQGTVERDYPAAAASGAGSGDIAEGARYGNTTVRSVLDGEGVRSAVAVDSFSLTHQALDKKGRIGALLGVDEIVHATDVTSSSFAPNDADYATSSTAKIGSLRVLGQSIGEAEGLVGGRLAKPVVREQTMQVDDPAAVMENLGVSIGDYLTQPLLGEASARVVVTVSQSHVSTANTVFATGLKAVAKAEFTVRLETQGSDRALIETATITADLGDLATVEIANTAAARNGAALPEPNDVEVPVDPGEPSEPGVTPLPVDHYTPTAAPDRLVTTLTGDAATTRTFTWRTSEDVSSAVVEYRVAGAGSVTSVPATTRAPGKREAEQGGLTAQYVSRTHTATLSGLAPATTYSYRVGDGGANFSDWHEFTTSSSSSDPFEFVYLGDAQNDIRAQWAGAAREMYSKTPDARLVIHAGDLINHADNDLEWGEWFGADPKSIASVVQVPVPGNHEFIQSSLQESWHENFTLPKNGPQVDPKADSCTQAYQGKISSSLANSVYYLDYQGVRFISLSGTLALADILPASDVLEAAGCGAEAVDMVKLWADLQATWLDQTLEANPGQWAVASIHQPIFSTSVGRDNSHTRAAWLPVFEKHNIDLVLQGHDHTYGRGHLIQNEVEGVAGLQTGPVYAVSVLGPKMYKLDKNEQNNFTLNAARRVTAYENTRTFQQISVKSGHLSYTAVEYKTGEVVDSLEICKSPTGGKFVAEAGVELPTNCSTGEENPNPGEGGENPGGETPGGETPGGETPGGETPGGETPGGSLTPGVTAAPGTVPSPATDAQLAQKGAGGVEIVAVDGLHLTVKLAASRAGDWVAPYIHSNPTFLGWQKVDAAGLIRVTLPTGLAVGEHRLAVLDAEGALIGSDLVLIDATNTADGVARLPRTGAEQSWLVWWLAGGMLLVGAAAVVTARARRV